MRLLTICLINVILGNAQCGDEDELIPAPPTNVPVPAPTPSTVEFPTPSPGEYPTNPPIPASTLAPVRCCTQPRSIPSECEADLLAEELDQAANEDPSLPARWLRLAFHDAGTFDQAVPEGGANGCLLSNPLMGSQPENENTGAPLSALESIKTSWEGLSDTCVSISNSDLLYLLQYASIFAVVRQKGTPGLNAAKRAELRRSFLPVGST